MNIDLNESKIRILIDTIEYFLSKNEWNEELDNIHDELVNMLSKQDNRRVNEVTSLEKSKIKQTWSCSCGLSFESVDEWKKHSEEFVENLNK